MGLGFSAVGLFGKLPFLCSSAVTFTFKDLSVSRSVRWATHEVIAELDARDPAFGSAHSAQENAREETG